jgi:hypothetical protein
MNATLEITIQQNCTTNINADDDDARDTRKGTFMNLEVSSPPPKVGKSCKLTVKTGGMCPSTWRETYLIGKPSKICPRVLSIVAPTNY